MSTPEPPAPTPSGTTDSDICADCGRNKRDYAHYVWDREDFHNFVPPASAPAATAGTEDRIHSGPECVRCGRREVWHPDGSCHFFAPKPAAPTGEEAETPERLVTEFWHAVAEWERKNQRNNKHTRPELSAAYERAQAAYDAVESRLTAQATELAALRARVRNLAEDALAAAYSEGATDADPMASDSRRTRITTRAQAAKQALLAALAPRQTTEGHEHG